jgi:hypothetical protein
MALHKSPQTSRCRHHWALLAPVLGFVDSSGQEIGNELTAEEMEGQRATDGAAQAPEKPQPESIHAAESHGGAQTASAARAATTVSKRTGIARASRTLGSQPRKRCGNPHAVDHASE